MLDREESKIHSSAERIAGNSGRTGRRALLLGCVLIAVFKLWLVAEDEVVARANPMDQLRYLEMAQALTHGEWLGEYHPLTLIREPGYPGWVALVAARSTRPFVASNPANRRQPPPQGV